MNWVTRWFDRLNSLFAGVTKALGIVMIVTVTYEVFMRKLFHPTMWVVDYNEHILVFMAYLPLAWILASDGHIKMDIVLNRFSPRRQAVMNIVSSFLGLFYIGVLTWLTVDWTWEALREGRHFNTMTGLPMFPVVIVMPLGTFLLSLGLVRKIVQHIRSLGRTKE